MGAIKTAFIALVHPHLEYCAPVWSPYTKESILIDALENVDPEESIKMGVCCKVGQK